MNDLQVFNFNDNEVRTMIINDEPWFVGKDVADVLGYSNTRDALKKRVDDEDKGVANCDTLGGKQDITIINESGVYALVFGSKLDRAKEFKHWVTHDVLPTIRKTGRYETPADPMAALKLMFDAATQTNEKVAVIEHKVNELQDNAPLNPGEYNLVNTKVCERIRTIKRERRMELNKEQNSELFKSINREIKAITGVHTRSQLRQKHLEGVLEFINDWEPSKATMVVISQMSADI